VGIKIKTFDLYRGDIGKDIVDDIDQYFGVE
jgi:hypothetical protein